MSIEALNAYLQPLASFLDDAAVSEISINRPMEAWVEIGGEFVRHTVPQLSFDHLLRTANLVASYTEQDISEHHPLLSANLPDGYRIQFVIPPACPANTIVVSVRKQVLKSLTLDHYVAMGAFESTSVYSSDSDDHLRELYQSKRFDEFLKTAIRYKKNMIVSGGCSTGKTTFMNACLNAVPIHERLITIEDNYEVKPPHQNVARLWYSRGTQSLSKVGAQELLEASLRLRPDRIIMGELRGGECYAFLRAVNSGHEGSMSTIHADSTTTCFDQMALMVMQAGLGLNKTEIVDYIRSIIHCVVQLKFVNKKRVVHEVYYDHG